MPNRLIREGLVDSERVNNLDYDEECFYHRLLLKADDAGRYDGRLQVLRSHLFPLGYKTHSDPVLRGIDGCQREGLIKVYEVVAHEYIQVTNWRKAGAAKISKWPGADGTYAIRFVMMPTNQGPKEFVDTSVRSLDMKRISSSSTPLVNSEDTIYEDEDGDGKVQPGTEGVISKENGQFQKYINFLKNSKTGHTDFHWVPDIAIINALRGVAEEKWQEAIESMCHHYAGAKINAPVRVLENYLAGKMQAKNKGESRSERLRRAHGTHKR